jgi:hypothetical protein
MCRSADAEQGCLLWRDLRCNIEAGRSQELHLIHYVGDLPEPILVITRDKVLNESSDNLLLYLNGHEVLHRWQPWGNIASRNYNLGATRELTESFHGMFGYNKEVRSRLDVEVPIRYGNGQRVPFYWIRDVIANCRCC